MGQWRRTFIGIQDEGRRILHSAVDQEWDTGVARRIPRVFAITTDLAWRIAFGASFVETE